MSSLLNWLEQRTGIGSLMRAALYERIPGGSRWRYVWGSTLVFTFSIQVITGLFLWMFYSPSSQTAWESVYFIQFELGGGWLLRGLHHFTAQAMVVLLALHFLQIVIDGAYRAPREFNFWIGLLLMQILLALSLTGYLLPWDQKGFWATKVATNLLGIVPGVGPQLQQLVVGGNDYGHHTLTHFFALHAGLLPGLLIGLLVVHLYLFRRHGVTPKDSNAAPEQMFWPHQILKDAAASLVVLVVVLGLILWPGFGEPQAFEQPGEHLGAHLGAPADPAVPYSAARPEWYFLFLYQFLKYFPGEAEIYGAVVIPAAVMAALFLMPLLGHWRIGHALNVALVVALFIGIGGLTVVAIREDQLDAGYQQAVAEAEQEAHRAQILAQQQGIPPSGALTLIRDDPKTQGPRLFASHGCSSCHLHQPLDEIATSQSPGNGEESDSDQSAESDPGESEPDLGAPNLYGFASREWLAALLDPEQVAGPNFFGRTAHAEGDMVSFVLDTVAEYDEEQKAELADAIVALSAEAGLPSQKAADEQDAEQIERGRLAISESLGCTDCHKFRDAGDLGYAPDLTGYGSREWLTGIIRDPTHERYYGENNDRMPAFKDRMTDRQIGLVADWLRGDWVTAEPTPEASETVTVAELDDPPPNEAPQ